MPEFGKASLAKLATCDQRLQDICNEAIKVMDFSVIDGHRGKEAQDRAFADEKSDLPWPKSKHNSFPSKAVDIVPYPVDWYDKDRFNRLAGLIFGIAASKGIKLRWGGTWGGLDGKYGKRIDMPHFELVD